MLLKDFLNTSDCAGAILTHCKKSNILNGYKSKEITELSFIDVTETIPNLIRDLDFENAFMLCLDFGKRKLNFAQVEMFDNYEKLYFLAWIIEELKNIAKMEKDYLFSSPSKKMLQSGADKLNVLGSFNVIDEIAKKYKYTHKEVERLSYDTVFKIQWRDKILNDIKLKMSK